jgi:exopolysaccharide biosynthesis polyprenyl glycosylphosphotransferase
MTLSGHAVIGDASLTDEKRMDVGKGAGGGMRAGGGSPATTFADEREEGVVLPVELAQPPTRWAGAAEFAHSAISLPPAFWATLDSGLAIAAVLLAHALSPEFGFASKHGAYSPITVAIIFALLLPACHYTSGLYDRLNFPFAGRMLLLAAASTAVAVAATIVVHSSVKYVQIGRYIVALTWILSTFATVSLRLLARSVAGQHRLRLLFVGRPDRVTRLAETISTQYAHLYAQPQFLDLTGAARGTEFRLLAEYCQRVHPHEIVIEDDSEIVLDLVANAAAVVSEGIVIRTLSSVYEAFLQELPVEILDSRSMMGAGFTVGRRTTALVKRALDMVISFIGLVVATPLMIGVAALIAATSGRPVIFAQRRVGQFGRTFNMYKFRTMQLDAEKNGAVWAAANDTRVTRIGRFLRKSRLDELPQLWNILRGDMSFVGPRPERPEFVADLAKEIPHYNLRHLVPPGLSGWAQIKYPYGATVEDAQRKLCFDLYYIRHYSLLSDIGIFFKTIVSMARGAR